MLDRTHAAKAQSLYNHSRKVCNVLPHMRSKLSTLMRPRQPFTAHAAINSNMPCR